MEIQIRTTMRYHYESERMVNITKGYIYNVVQAIKQTELSCIAL